MVAPEHFQARLLDQWPGLCLPGYHCDAQKRKDPDGGDQGRSFGQRRIQRKGTNWIPVGQTGRKAVQILYGLPDQAAGLSRSLFDGAVYGDREGIVNDGMAELKEIA